MKVFLLHCLAISLQVRLASGVFTQNIVLAPIKQKSREELNQQIDEQLGTDEANITAITERLNQIQELIDSGFPTDNDNEAQEAGNGNTEDPDETEYSGTEIVDHEFPVYINPYKELDVLTGSAERDYMTDRTYIGYVRDKASGISGMCASRVHDGVMYYLNDNHEDEPYIYAVDIEHGCSMKARIKLTVEKDDWEDMACGPCEPYSETKYCIYVIDDRDGDIYLTRFIYKIPEPEVLQGEIIHDVQEDEIIEFYSDLEYIHTLMVHPSGSIYVMGRTEYDFYLNILVDYGSFGWATEELFDVAIWTSYDGPVAADISFDGKGWLFKMFDRVYYFYVEDGGEWDIEYVMSDSDNRVKMQYTEEDYGTAVAWTKGMGSFVTVSEGLNEPWYRYYRLA